MSKTKLHWPQTQRQGEAPVDNDQSRFFGMLGGIPASEVPATHDAKLVNLIGYRAWQQVRPGAKRFTEAVRGTTFVADAITDRLTTAVDHPWQTGQVVYVSTSDTLPAPLAIDTPYYAIRVNATTLQLATTYANAVIGAQINITDAGVGVHRISYGRLNARIQNHKNGLIVWMFGIRVYVSDRRISEYIPVLNENETWPSGLSMAEEDGDDVIITSPSGIFRVVLDEAFYHMYPINTAPPIVLITDVPENTGAGEIWGHRYIYGTGRLSGTDNRTRITEDVELQFESATCFVPGEEKDFGEVFFDSPIDNDPADPHVISIMTVPDATDHATHMPLFRTKNIGENSGGATAGIAGLGNRTDYMVWVDDVPIAKAYNIDDPAGGNVLTIPAGNNNTELGEIGGALQLRDLLGGAPLNRVITVVDPVGRTITVNGAGINGAHVATIGAGRIFRASQAGVIVTCNQPAAGVFVVGDVGKPIFVADGTLAWVEEYISATQVQVTVAAVWNNLGCTMKPAAGNFYRWYNDTTLDDGGGTTRISLNDRILSGMDLYIPRRFFKPLPNGDVIAVDSGFMIIGIRDEAHYYYCQTGDEPYNAGYYRNDIQRFEMNAPMRHFFKFPSVLMIPCAGKTYTLPLNTSTNVGRTDIGENIFKLQQPIISDDNTGIVAWASAEFKGQSLIWCITDEPAVRTFDGHTYSKQNHAIDVVTNLDAVQKTDIDRLDLFYGVNAIYTQLGGYKVWGYKWVVA